MEDNTLPQQNPGLTITLPPGVNSQMSPDAIMAALPPQPEGDMPTILATLNLQIPGPGGIPFSQSPPVAALGLPISTAGTEAPFLRDSRRLPSGRSSQSTQTGSPVIPAAASPALPTQKYSQ